MAGRAIQFVNSTPLSFRTARPDWQIRKWHASFDGLVGIEEVLKQAHCVYELTVSDFLFVRIYRPVLTIVKRPY